MRYLAFHTLFQLFRGISSTRIFTRLILRFPQALVLERRWDFFCDIFSHDCSLAYRLAIPRLSFSKKVTHLFVIFDLLRSVFLLKEVADFDPGSLDFVSF